MLTYSTVLESYTDWINGPRDRVGGRRVEKEREGVYTPLFVDSTGIGKNVITIKVKKKEYFVFLNSKLFISLFFLRSYK